MSAPIKGSYIDTQGMSGPADPDAKSTGKQEYKPAIIKPRRLFTPTYAKEMKILINEVLDEREGKMNYKTYFDTEPFKHSIDDEEPPYEGAQYPNLRG